MTKLSCAILVGLITGLCVFAAVMLIPDSSYKPIFIILVAFLSSYISGEFVTKFLKSNDEIV
ncbi:hypothetical protein NC661_04695 [Aquibacillus koreensis]|uniref:Uncharacterized protein n=1 Tax=Aquibacillus koreensis TaxID=279446 RepID=A0A9X4AIT1_9BACI|nr:hypothetical protein [Aquibacillus koreensis]MCT2534727.1 hypothetical protein [Aquibacillus koreensis]MDC3419663.1 hypothetical protein [Aquibacillus koreensis]